jgi:hypothetical protein
MPGPHNALAGIAAALFGVTGGGLIAYTVLSGGAPETPAVAPAGPQPEVPSLLALKLESAAVPAADVPVDEVNPVAALYQAEIRQAATDLPGLFLTDEQAAELGLRIVANGFDNRHPPKADAVFRYPLPGQTPRSVIVAEFFASRFLLGRAQSYEIDGAKGRLGIVAWAFADAEGADRAFRALRDLSGRPWRPSGFAPDSALVEDGERRTSDLLWVQGQLLLRASYAVPEGVHEARLLRGRLANVLAEQARAYSADVPAAPAILPADPTLAGHLGRLTVPERELPGGHSTRAAAARSSLFFEPGGSGTGGILTTDRAARFSDLGFVGLHVQAIRVSHRPRGSYALFGYAFDTDAGARRALAHVRKTAGGRVSRSSLFPGAWVVEGPNGPAYSDVYWVRGPLLLQAGVYSPATAPLSLQVRDRLAKKLDRQSRAFLSG